MNSQPDLNWMRERKKKSIPFPTVLPKKTGNLK